MRECGRMCREKYVRILSIYIMVVFAISFTYLELSNIHEKPIAK